MNEEAFGLSNEVSRISFIDQFIPAHTDNKYVGHSVVGGDQDNIVSIATHNRLDCPEVKCQWRQDFSHPSGTALGST